MGGQQDLHACIVFMLIQDHQVLAEQRTLTKKVMPGGMVLPGGHEDQDLRTHGPPAGRVFVSVCHCRFCHGPPIYEALLERDLTRDGPLPDLQTPVVLECTVQEGVRFAGKQVCKLGLPDGGVLVTLQRGFAELVPTLHTRLDVGDRLTAVIASQTPEALALLREGCERP